MFDRHPRRDNGPRTRRRPALIAPERLEGRELMAFTPLGFSIPDLAIANAFTGPVAAPGGPLAVTVDVTNLGQSSIPEPLAGFPGAPSAADAGPTEIAVFLTNRPHAPFGRRVFLGTIDVPAIPQNRLARITEVVTLPDQFPRRFPGIGETAFVTFVLDPSRQIQDLDRTNNVLRPAASFQVVPDLPDLATTALALPPSMSPGDVVIPELKVANLGAAATNEQAPSVTVLVVASTDPLFGPGDEILVGFEVPNILPLALAPSRHIVPGDETLIDPVNVVTLDAEAPVTLPEMPSSYFVGVVVDPFNQILELSEIGRGPDPTLEQVRVVAPSGVDLPPAGVIGEPSDLPFPFMPFSTPTGTPVDATQAQISSQNQGSTDLFQNRPIQRLIDRGPKPMPAASKGLLDSLLRNRSIARR